MKLTNCYRYMAVLYTASCGAASPLYGPLETQVCRNPSF